MLKLIEGRRRKSEHSANDLIDGKDHGIHYRLN